MQILIVIVPQDMVLMQHIHHKHDAHIMQVALGYLAHKMVYCRSLFLFVTCSGLLFFIITGLFSLLAYEC